MKRIFATWIRRVYARLPFKVQVFSILKKFHPQKSIYRHLHFNGLFSVTVGRGQFKMIHYGYELENELFWRGVEGWEKTTLRIWIEMSRHATHIIDVGANTGVFALLSKAVHPSAHVYAFEPVARVYDKLVKNIKVNEFDIKAEQKALSNFNGTATIYDLPTEHIYSVTINENLNPEGAKVIPTLVNTITLDSYCRENKIEKIDLLKIDVETHESEVLEGAIEILRISRPVILIEILNNNVAEKVNRILKEFDYVYFELNEISGPVLKSEIRPHAFFNYLICEKKDVERVLKLWNEEKASS